LSISQYYKQEGKDWGGNCAGGSRQSPINIIDQINTKKDENTLVILDYKYNESLDLSKMKPTYDGSALKINLKGIGQLSFKNHMDKKWVEEIYDAE
jgi:carbonic anhydrase